MAGEALGSLVITLREALEAGLIIAVIVTTLNKTGRQEMKRYVALGLAASLGLGLATGYAVWLLYGGFPEKALFEGLASLLAAVILTWVIYWMAKTGPKLAWDITRKVTLIASGAALAGFTFVITYREALETVLFLVPYMLSKPTETLVGAGVGMAIALTIAYMIYVAGYRLSLRKFFLATSLMLVFVASGILGYGIHELAEYVEEKGIYEGVLVEEAYNLGISEDSLFHHKGLLGSILAVLFGYSVSMEWIRVVFQAGYLAIMIPMILKVYGINPFRAKSGGRG